VKTTNTPPKTTINKSNHDFENKSQRMSVDDSQNNKNPKLKKVRDQNFENKIKLFMERN